MFENVEVVHQKFGEWWQVDEVVVPSQEPYLTGSGFLHPEVADFVRDVNLKDVIESPVRIPVLYISREQSRHRRMLDEQQLLKELHSNFPIRVAHLESYSYVEQMSLMQSVDVLVGTYGAGLTHVLFSKRQGLIEIHNGDSKETHFATLALATRCPYVQVQGGQSDVRQDFELGKSGIAGVLSALGAMVR
jgi:capsular polysaccharide biosynthesis protein